MLTAFLPPQKALINFVVRLLHVRIVEFSQKLVKLAVVAWWYLNPS